MSDKKNQSLFVCFVLFATIIVSCSGNPRNSYELMGCTREQTMCDLSFKGLTTIAPFSFSGYSKLTHLDLTGNSLDHLDSNSFFGLTNLENLELKNNNLTDIASGSFKDLESLNTLKLENRVV
jgi:Leucine-rich repeat (LRR) protein